MIEKIDRYYLEILSIQSLKHKKKPNENLVSFSKKISSYIYQIINFITYSSDERPWPFNAFPDKADWLY